MKRRLRKKYRVGEFRELCFEFTFDYKGDIESPECEQFLHSFVDDCRQEQVRMFYPLINGACVISERSPHNEFGKAIVECPANKLVGTVHHVLDNGLWNDVGMNAPEVYRKHCEERKK